jgi:large subunit ribosomal protein L10
VKKATLNKKVEKVNEAQAKFNEAKSAVVVDYLGLTVAEVSELRTNLYNAGCELKVIKNNIILRAVNACGYEGIQDHLAGPSAVAFGKDATSAPKIIFDFAKKNDKLEVKAGIVEGKYYETKDLKVLASLPNKEGMISMLLSVLQAPIRNLGCAIKAVAEKSEQVQA